MKISQTQTKNGTVKVDLDRPTRSRLELASSLLGVRREEFIRWAVGAMLPDLELATQHALLMVELDKEVANRLRALAQKSRATPDEFVAWCVNHFWGEEERGEELTANAAADIRAVREAGIQIGRRIEQIDRLKKFYGQTRKEGAQ